MELNIIAPNVAGGGDTLYKRVPQRAIWEILLLRAYKTDVSRTL